MATPAFRFVISSFIIFCLFFCISSAKLMAAEYKIASYPSDLGGQLLIQNFQPPVIMKANNQQYLVYEIVVTNFQGESINLNSLTIKDPNSRTLFSFKEDELKKITRLVGSVEFEKEPLKFETAIAKMIYIWLPFKSGDVIPKHLKHEFSITTESHLTLSSSAIIPINTKYVNPIIGNPVKGNNWVSAGGPSNDSHHRLANIVINNQINFGERYAIDFVKVGDNGLTYQGDEHKNTSYYCYGEDIIAVADGRVVGVQDGLQENTPHSGTMAIPFSLKTGPGNYIVIDIGNGNYAFYWHLIPNSMKVKEEEFVKKGQVIAKLGNSGHSIEPHLHFQISAKPLSTQTNSLPYEFDHFYKQNAEVQMMGQITELKVKVLDSHVQEFKDQLMLKNWVINF